MPSQETIEKIPPHNIDAEMAVLGSMLIDQDVIAEAIETLDEAHFYKDSHRKIFSAVVKLFDENKGVDLVTLIEELKRTGSLDSLGGPSFITGLASSVPTSANFVHYANIIKEKKLLRKLISAATQIASESYDPSQNVEAVVDKAEQLIFDVSQKKVASRFASLKEIIKSSVETIDKLYQRKESITGLATGFRDLDIKTAGLQPSDLIIVANNATRSSHVNPFQIKPG
jgi:replicative DNA helicase